MKVAINKTAMARRGYALMLVLVFSAISLAVLTGALDWSSGSSRLTQRHNDYYACIAAAEAATEQILATIMRDFKNGSEAALLNNLTNYQAMAPSGADNLYWNDFEFSNAAGQTNATYVQQMNSKVYTNLNSKYKGLQGWLSTYRIISNARLTTRPYSIAGAVQQEIQVASIPIFQYAIFYEDLLEFTWAAPFNVRGRVHANDHIYTGSSAPLTFHEDVTSVGVNNKTPWWGFSMGHYSGDLDFLSNKETNTAALVLPIGTNNTSSAIHAVLEKPPIAESVNSEMGRQRYYNKAQMTITVNANSTVTTAVKEPYSTSETSIPYADIAYFLTGDSMYDQRESKTMILAEIDVGKFKTWSETNQTVQSVLGMGKEVDILWIDDNRSVSSSQQTGIRLVNGKVLPEKGLTVATPDPMYVLGHYNQPINSHLGTTNTTATAPASLASDALTILSDAWDDNESTWNFTYRDATHTTVNAAVITGIVPSAGYQGSNPMSGGVMNLPRLLEDWGNGSKVLTLNGSIVNLFESTEATQPFQWPGYYYYAPTRNFNFDRNYLDVTKLPPGTPQLRVLLRGTWSAPPVNTTNYVASN